MHLLDERFISRVKARGVDSTLIKSVDDSLIWPNEDG